ncbi:hypothetical protein BD410DRAFT_719758 [Rickenella mellea]|uniref:Uncharacterized protein n=1 Tax=Rickenella mellea TaxID=50990 RepID=A0A4Y7QBE0_9AGAM|nr:hypothetical protein BD410DRAFT_719758 [Rickenella mellea]
MFYFILATLATPRNHTIDDTIGDDITGDVPTYTPSSVWNAGQDCPSCSVQPDQSLAFDQTWHAATYGPSDNTPRSIDFSFNGTAIYVFGIIANKVSGATTLTNITVVLDGKRVGSFVHTPDNTNTLKYNVLLYGSPSIPRNNHHVTLQLNGATSTSLLLFDYAIYT